MRDDAAASQRMVFGDVAEQMECNVRHVDERLTRSSRLARWCGRRCRISMGRLVSSIRFVGKSGLFSQRWSPVQEWFYIPPMYLVHKFDREWKSASGCAKGENRGLARLGLGLSD